MILPALLLLLAVLLALAAGRDLLADRHPSTRPARPNDHSDPGQPDLPSGRSGPTAGRQLLAALGGLTAGLPVAAWLPGRAGSLLLAGTAIGGWLLPGLLRSRRLRTRRRRIVIDLPDALDLLAVSLATGRSLAASLSDLGRSGRGPLSEELARVGADLRWGGSQLRALEALRDRVGGPEVAALVAALDRSRRLGSPLADELERHSTGLRQAWRRRIGEEAARAAPKIQLVIALVLVPAVLLLLVAALVANAGVLLPAGP